MADTDTTIDEAINELASQLSATITDKYGVMVGGDELLKLLGYSTQNALRIAIHNKTINVPIFTLDQRRTKFALSQDIARWLAEQRFKNDIRNEGGKSRMNKQ